MFGRRKVQEQPPAEPGRYRVRFVPMVMAKDFPPHLEAALNEGEASGWRLVDTHAVMATGALIIWDTEGS